ncbi:hypothetical protein OAL19_00820 [bacterium]|nr:hypothetical protein [bacterium]
MINSLIKKTGTLGYFSQAKALITKSRNSVPDTKVVVFSQGRSGSHVLMQLLGGHPDAYTDGSLIGHRVVAPFRYIDFRSQCSGKNIYGFKVKPFHIQRQNISMTDFFAHLINKNWKVIHLERSNKCRQCISNLYAEKIKTGHVSKSNKMERPKINVDVDKIIRGIGKREERAKNETRVMKEIPHLKLNYEEDLLPQEKHSNTVNRVFQWLGVAESSAKIGIEPSTPKRTKDFIANFDELASALQSNGYAHFLERSNSK